MTAHHRRPSAQKKADLKFNVAALSIYIYIYIYLYIRVELDGMTKNPRRAVMKEMNQLRYKCKGKERYNIHIENSWYVEVSPAKAFYRSRLCSLPQMMAQNHDKGGFRNAQSCYGMHTGRVL